MDTWWVGSEGCDTWTPGGWGVRDVIHGLSLNFAMNRSSIGLPVLPGLYPVLW